MTRRSLAAAILALNLSALPVSGSLAHSVEAGPLTITDLWTRATPPTAPSGGGYLTIENSGAEADRLIAVSSPTAGRVEIHEMSMQAGTMIMQPVAGGIEIPAGGSVTLAPGGSHIMFMGLKETFTEGGKVPVILHFERAGDVETFLHVESLGAKGPDSGQHGHGQ